MSALSESDYQSLINDFNATDEVAFLGHRLDQLFETIAQDHAFDIAVIHDETQVSYRELNASANLLARGLIKRGVQYGDLVGLAVERSIDLVVAVLSVLKLGAAYVP